MNIAPYEPAYDDEQLHTFAVINQLDPDRADLADPCDVLIAQQEDISSLLEE